MVSKNPKPMCTNYSKLSFSNFYNSKSKLILVNSIATGTAGWLFDQIWHPLGLKGTSS